jgi:hypothetical protein
MTMVLCRQAVYRVESAARHLDANAEACIWLSTKDVGQIRIGCIDQISGELILSLAVPLRKSSGIIGNGG